jgi:transposase
VPGVFSDEHVRLMAKKDERLKGSKYLWLKGFERMDPQAKLRFNELKSSGLKVSRAWSMKDLFNEFWSFEFGWDAKEFFRDWCNWVMRSKLEPMKRVARMLKKHSSGLFGYIIHPITNAATEGLNSKIQNIKASARGFRRFDAYRTAILFYCGKLDMLPATVPQKS